jgi:hypothetical protein
MIDDLDEKIVYINNKKDEFNKENETRINVEEELGNQKTARENVEKQLESKKTEAKNEETKRIDVEDKKQLVGKQLELKIIDIRNNPPPQLAIIHIILYFAVFVS